MQSVEKWEIGKSRSLLKRYKEQLHYLTPIQREVGVGVMLGDASLQSQDGGKSYRLKFLQGDQHRKYLDHLCEIFFEWILSPPAPQHRRARDGKILKAWRVQTISHPAVLPLAKIFLDGRGKKISPPDIVNNYCTPRALAYWLMDDGGLLAPKRRGVVLHTQGLLRCTGTEVHSLVEGLKKVYNLHCWVGENKNRPVIKISGHCWDQLFQLVGEFIHPSMVYKFPPFVK